MGKDISSVVKVSELFQVGIVVRDLEESMKRYKDIMGIESWQVVEINPSIIAFTYRDSPSQHSFKAAFTMLGSLMVELLQPLDGIGTYREFLDTRGEGVHHLGHARVDNLDEAIVALEKAGFQCVETGATRGDPAAGYHKWAYVDMTAALGYFLEFSSGLDPRDVFGVR